MSGPLDLQLLVAGASEPLYVCKLAMKTFFELPVLCHKRVLQCVALAGESVELWVQHVKLRACLLDGSSYFTDGLPLFSQARKFRPLTPTLSAQCYEQYSCTQTPGGVVGDGQMQSEQAA